MPSTTGFARYDVAALGELVVDLVPAGHAGHDALFAAKPGGAPGNVAAGAARLGLRAAMLSKVGHGYFGDVLIDTLRQAGVETGGIVRSATDVTALAVVSVDLHGQPHFTLYHEGCADANYDPRELDREIVGNCRVLHVGSLSLGTPRSAATHRAAVKLAKEAGALISTDVNFRPALWRDRAAMLAVGREAVAAANIVKLSEDELSALAGTADLAEAVAALWHPDLKVLAVTRGAVGAELFTADDRVAIPGFEVEVVDTVGCGDAFMAALLAGLLADGNYVIGTESLRAIGRTACAAGAIVAGVSGAMQSMPSAGDIAAFMKART